MDPDAEPGSTCVALCERRRPAKPDIPCGRPAVKLRAGYPLCQQHYDLLTA